MIQGIITVAISVLSATGILGIGTRAILSRMKKQDSRQKALEYGVQACYTAITSILKPDLHPSMQKKIMKICTGSIMNSVATV